MGRAWPHAQAFACPFEGGQGRGLTPKRSRAPSKRLRNGSPGDDQWLACLSVCRASCRWARADPAARPRNCGGVLSNAGRHSTKLVLCCHGAAQMRVVSEGGGGGCLCRRQFGCVRAPQTRSYRPAVRHGGARPHPMLTQRPFLPRASTHHPLCPTLSHATPFRRGGGIGEQPWPRKGHRVLPEWPRQGSIPQAPEAQPEEAGASAAGVTSTTRMATRVCHHRRRPARPGRREAQDPRLATRLESGRGLLGLTAYDPPSAPDAVAPLLVAYCEAVGKWVDALLYSRPV